MTRNSLSIPTGKRTRWGSLLAVLSLQAAFIPHAFGALGGTLDSVQSDQHRMMATMKSADASGYTIHEITTSAGIVVREYVGSSGRVFGVAWEGPFMPDLRQILGPYFKHFATAAKAKRGSIASRNRLVISEPGIVLESTGHMRAYSGRAYDPGLLPEGIHGNDVR